MSVKCQVVIDALEKMAPRYLAEEWDNVGLLIGSPSATVHKVLTCLDVTQAVADKAIEKGAELIVAHHPPIFRAIKKLRTDSYLGKLLTKIIKNDVAVYAAHTNLDSASGGVNDILAEKLALKDIGAFVDGYREELLKLSVFVPEDYADAVRRAIGKAGAGFTGKYSDCSFSSIGEGRFTAREGARPFIGNLNESACVREVKIETILPARQGDRVVRAMLKAHPYEEAAFDLIALKNTGRAWGLGRVGRLETALPLREVAKLVKDALQLENVRFVGDAAKPVQKVALCSGSGAEFLSKASFMGADVYITGDVKYHEAQRALELGISLIDAGHFGTEFPIAAALQNYLKKCSQDAKWDVEIVSDDFSRDVFQTI